MVRTDKQRYRDAFFMDLENWCLEHRWYAPPPIGCSRHIDSPWGDMMKDELNMIYPLRTYESKKETPEFYPERTWHDYCDWVVDGGGDEWFQPEEAFSEITPE